MTWSFLGVGVDLDNRRHQLVLMLKSETCDQQAVWHQSDLVLFARGSECWVSPMRTYYALTMFWWTAKQICITSTGPNDKRNDTIWSAIFLIRGYAPWCCISPEVTSTSHTTNHLNGSTFDIQQVAARVASHVHDHHDDLLTASPGSRREQDELFLSYFSFDCHVWLVWGEFRWTCQPQTTTTTTGCDHLNFHSKGWNPITSSHLAEVIR